MSQPVVTMIVVSWNVRDALRQCLTAAIRSSGIQPELVVIDNHSADGSADMVAREFPSVRLIRNKKNHGFAAGVNQGIAGGRGHVLLLNPDLELQPDTVQQMVAWLERLPQVGIVGAQLHYPDGRIQPSVKRFPRWIDLALVLSKLPNLFPFLAKRYQATDMDYRRSQEVDQVMGSCFLIRDTARQQIGTLDEGFWIWYEEVDYCARATQLGWKVFYAADAQAVHGRGQSFQQLSTVQKQRYLRASIGYYARKHFGQVGGLALLPFAAVSWLSALVIQAAKWQKPEGAKEF